MIIGHLSIVIAQDKEPARPTVSIYNVAPGKQLELGTAATYYTKMDVGFTADRTDYALAFLPYGNECPSGFDCVDSPTNDTRTGTQNSPVSAAWVKVTDLPRNLQQPWSSTNTDQWIVEGEVTTSTDPEIQRGTLLSAGVHMGQYSMPFRIRITALAVLP